MGLELNNVQDTGLIVTAQFNTQSGASQQGGVLCE